MVLNGDAPSFVVLGGAGAIGRIVVRDLFESDKRNRIVVADFDANAAKATARVFRSRRVMSSAADATKPTALARILRGHDVVINCTRHQLNLNVMEAALQGRVHYVDLGGLFVWTRRQLRLKPRFVEAGITAVLGMGCAPGLTNMMAVDAAASMERVDSIRIRVGSIDFKAQADEFAFPYSAQTIVEELTLPPWKWSGGRFVNTKPRAGWELVPFGPPIGDSWVVMTRHSEIATLPRHFRRQGVRYVDFKVGFSRSFVRELLRRLRSGETIQEFESLSAPRLELDDYEITRVIVRGGKKTVTIDCHARSRPEWKASAGDIDTACPASIVAQMLATGTIRKSGVYAPEDVVPVQLLLAEVERRGMKITRTPRPFGSE